MAIIFSDQEFDAFLRDISEPFFTRDITNWRARMMLPFSMVTASGPVTLVTEADVRRNFELYLEASDTMGLDFVHREPIAVETCEDGTVLATYLTNLMHHGTRITNPYKSTALLHPHPEGWKMSAILNARGHHAWTGRHPNNTGE